jgi:oligoendopeptidase F
MPRKFTSFIKPNVRVNEWKHIEPYFNGLAQSTPKTLIGLQRLIREYSDTLRVFAGNGSQAMIDYWSDTQDIEAKQRIDRLMDETWINVENACHVIDKKVSQHPQWTQLDPRYKAAKRSILHWISAYHPENYDLDKEIEKTAMRTEEIMSMQYGNYPYDDLTLQEIAQYLESPDRTIREEAWFEIQGARLETKDKLDGLFNAMIHMRHKTGVNAGHSHYTRYEHFATYPQRTIRHAKYFHEVVKDVVAPRSHEITARHRKRLGITGKLRPWDSDETYWGIQGTPPHMHILQPFKNSEQLIAKTIERFDRIRPQYGRWVEEMAEQDCIDIESRKGKVGFSAYCITKENTGMPFISASVTRSPRDVSTVDHELGHAMHAMANRNKTLIWNGDFGIDMTASETASITMELIGMEHWDQLYDDPEDLRRAKRIHLEEIVRFLPWCAIVDKFQHWIYNNPQHTVQERDDYWISLMQDYCSPDVSWHGLELIQRNIWQKQSHIFSNPFYFIEYGLAILRAVQKWRAYTEASTLKQKQSIIGQYHKSLMGGGEIIYPRMWEVMGKKEMYESRFIPMGSNSFKPMVEDVVTYLMQKIDDVSDDI